MFTATYNGSLPDRCSAVIALSVKWRCNNKKKLDVFFGFTDQNPAGYQKVNKRWTASERRSKFKEV
jgi:hypothetical protein